MSQTTKRGPTGRRGETRQRILAAAHDAFAEMDYASATYREIARRAEVDPALIAYYFHSKAQLLRESLFLPEDPKKLIVGVLLGGPAEETGKRIAAMVLNTWEQAATAGTIQTLFRLLLQDSATQQVFASYVRENILLSLKQYLKMDVELPLELMMSSILGVLLSRYVVRLEPLASMETNELIDFMGATIQHMLDQMVTARE